MQVGCPLPVQAQGQGTAPHPSAGATVWVPRNGLNVGGCCTMAMDLGLCRDTWGLKRAPLLPGTRMAGRHISGPPMPLWVSAPPPSSVHFSGTKIVLFLFPTRL